MTRKIKTTVLFIAMMGSAMAQSGLTHSGLTVGFVTSHFNTHSSQRPLTGLNHPMTYGVMLGYEIDSRAALGLTVEYGQGDLKKMEGEEESWRMSGSAFIFPFNLKRVRPYFSSGLVFSRRSLDSRKNDIKTRLQLRQSVGLEVPVLPYASLQYDFAIYSDGLNYLGNVSSVGMRYRF